jgi:hypothetical protein
VSYILFTGAPGSKWSSVAENIYQSPDIDRSDSTSEREYKKDVVKHQGAYFDPGMEFDNARDNWNSPFSGTGKRIIKSHTFAYKLNELKDTGNAIVMVYRNDFECLEWWKQAGGFKITYPNYQYYKDIETIWHHIVEQNKKIMEFIKDNKNYIATPADNVDLCRLLDIDFPTNNVTASSNHMIHNYADKDIKVYVYK